MSEVIARSWRSNQQKTPTICNDWFVEFKTFSEYESPAVIERAINENVLRISGDRIISINPHWEEMRGNLAPAKNCYIYIFRKTEDYVTLWDEIYLGEDGNIRKEFPPRNGREEVSFVQDHLSMPTIEGGQRYIYFFLPSPFRIAAARITSLRTIIRESPLSNLYELFTIMNGPTLDEQCLENGTPEGDVFTVFVPNYLGYAAFLCKELERKLQDIHDFLNPSDEASIKIATFENLIHTFAQKDPSITNHIRDYEGDTRLITNRVGERRRVKTVSGVDKFKIEWFDSQLSQQLDLYEAEEDFRYTTPKSYVNWRYDRDLRKNHLQEQAEIVADFLVAWMEKPGFVLTLENLAYGSFDGPGTTRTRVNLPDNVIIDDLMAAVHTEHSFNSEEGGDLIEAWNGMLLNILNCTDRGQIFIRSIATNAYDNAVGSQTNESFSDYMEMLESGVENEKFDNSISDIILGAFKTTRSVSKGFAGIMQAVSVHIVTYAYDVEEIIRQQPNRTSLLVDVNGRPFKPTSNSLESFNNAISRTKKRVFEGRDVFLVFDDGNGTSPITSPIRDPNRSIRPSSLVTPDGARLEVERIETLSISSSTDTRKIELESKISSFNNALDAINVGVGLLQLVALAGKDDLQATDALSVAEIAVDFLGMLPQFQSKIATRSLGAAGAAISAVTSGIQAHEQLHEGDTDAAILLSLSSGTAAVSAVAFIVAVFAGAVVAPVAAVVAIIACVVSGIFGILSLFFDDTKLELLIQNCFWGTRWQESKLDDPEKTPWSGGTTVSEWPNVYSFFEATWTGNLNAQMDALTNIAYDFSIDQAEFYELRRNERTNLPETAGTIFINLEPTFLQEETEIEIEVVLLQNEEEVSDTKFRFDFTPNENVLYNFAHRDKTNFATLDRGESIEKIGCLLALKREERINGILTVIADIINMPTWSSRKHRRVAQSVYQLVVEPKDANDQEIDYIEVIQRCKENDTSSFFNPVSYHLQVKTSLFPSGKAGGAPVIEKKRLIYV